MNESIKIDHLPVPRQVSVAIAYRLTDEEIPRFEYLLVSSRKHSNSWVLPKGGVEEDEISDPGLSALREAWEEGGIRGEIIKLLHQSTDSRAHRDIRRLKIFIPRAEYSFWLIKVDRQSGVLNSWPEEKERERRWVPRETAIELVQWRQDGAVEALNKVDEQTILGQT